MRTEPNRQGQKKIYNKKNRRILLWVLVLAFLLLMSSCGLMYHLGKRAQKQAEPNRQTIRVEEEQEAETALSIYGIVSYTDGTEYSQASDSSAENQDMENRSESSRAESEDAATNFETGTVEIGDHKTGKHWKQMAAINFFTSPDGSQIYEKLYPGIEGRYDFYIRNTMKEITYMTVTMEEEINSKNGGTLPLEYQILNGDGAIISGDWKDAAALKAFPVTLQPEENVNYSIRWRWPYEMAAGQTADAYDTRLATSEDLTHGLRLMIHIEQ